MCNSTRERLQFWSAVACNSCRPRGWGAIVLQKANVAATHVTSSPLFCQQSQMRRTISVRGKDHSRKNAHVKRVSIGCRLQPPTIAYSMWNSDSEFQVLTPHVKLPTTIRSVIKNDHWWRSKQNLAVSEHVVLLKLVALHACRNCYHLLLFPRPPFPMMYLWGAVQWLINDYLCSWGSNSQKHRSR